jgi:hypothetical protein
MLPDRRFHALMYHKGICSHCERRRRVGRKASRGERLLIIILAALAFGAIVPDFPRLLPWKKRQEAENRSSYWYPLGTLGFRADNDGKVISVEKGGPAEEAGVREGDFVDLPATPRSARRAVNQFVLVSIREPLELHVRSRVRPAGADDPGPDEAFELSAAKRKDLKPVPEKLRIAGQFGLFIAQVAACFFIAFAAWLVWHCPSWQTWGLFLFSLWFNSGQYFFWYANLGERGLLAFNSLQAVFEALGLAGILLFAMYFPEKPAAGAAKPVWLLVCIPFVLLWAVRHRTFANYRSGAPTEDVYLVWFFLTIAVFILVGSLLLYRHMAQAENRPQIRIVALGATLGLAGWLLAETHETIGVPGMLSPDSVDLLYAASVLLPIAVTYTVWRFRVIDVRFPLARVMLLFLAALLVSLFFAAVHAVAGESLHKTFEDLHLPLGIGLSLAVVFVESRTHHFADALLFRRWHKTKRWLKRLAADMSHAADLADDEITKRLLEGSVTKLRLKCGAVYKRALSGEFTQERPFGLAIDCQKCNQAIESRMVPLSGRDRIFSDLVARCESARPPGRLQAGTDPMGLESSGHFDSGSFATPIMAAPFPRDWSGMYGIEGFTTPAYAIPIVRASGDKWEVTRIVVFGPHVMDQAIARDEIRVLEDLCAAAATAYRTAELHRSLSMRSWPLGADAAGNT